MEIDLIKCHGNNVDVAVGSFTKPVFLPEDNAIFIIKTNAASTLHIIGISNNEEFKMDEVVTEANVNTGISFRAKRGVGIKFISSTGEAVITLIKANL